MPGLSWSLEAIKTCPGSRGKDGKLVEVCSGCYATSGNYKRFPNVNKLRQHNREDWKRDDWVTDMVKALKKEEYFRWFDSGDVYHPKLAEKIYEVMKLTHWCHHWLPTRSHKIPSIKHWLKKMNLLTNVKVRYSSDRVDSFDKKKHNSVVYSEDKWCDESLWERALVHYCPASSQGEACNDCRKCWDKSIKIIAYLAHGKPMKKLLDMAA